MELAILLGIVVVVGIAFYVGRLSGHQPRGEAQLTITTEFRSAEVESDDSDAWEGGFWDAPDPKPLSAHLQFHYVDGRGNRTSRSVVVRQFDNGLYGGILIGLCELRDANRTFRFDRISHCVDLETGESIEDVRQHLNERYDRSPERSVEILLSDYLDTLKVLYFVAKADGQYRREEKEVVAGYIRKLIRDDRVTVAMVDDALKAVGVPSMQAFEIAAGRVLKSGQVDPTLLRRCCEEIVATQATVHATEQEALDYIERKRAAIEASAQQAVAADRDTASQVRGRSFAALDPHTSTLTPKGIADFQADIERWDHENGNP
ncbi:MAG: hypothetical protein AB7G68_07945 [Nitrospiraceae bacterium]